MQQANKYENNQPYTPAKLHSASKIERFTLGNAQELISGNKSQISGIYRV